MKLYSIKVKGYFIPVVICLAVSISLVSLNVAFKVSSGKIVKETVKIVIDAGHGGIDGGAVGIDGVVEKDINLSIANKLNELATICGYEVVMLRDKDESLHEDGVEGIKNQKTSDLKQRLKAVNSQENSIFVSIHQNHYTEEKYSGAQVFYGGKNSESQRLASYIQNNIVEFLQSENNREIKPAEKNLYIIYNAKPVSVLVECGFLSNYDECKALQDEEYQQKIAFLILKSLEEFLESQV